MAKKGKEKNSKKTKEDAGGLLEKLNYDHGLGEEIVDGMRIIFFSALSIFFILAAMDRAGIVGDKVSHFLFQMLGVGYWSVPILFATLASSYIGENRPSFARTRILGSILFLLSSLGLIELIFIGQGGVFGHLIASPLVTLFDFYATLVFLFSFFIVSLLVIFNSKLHVAIPESWWRRKQNIEPEIKGIPHEEIAEEREPKKEEVRKEEVEQKETEPVEQKKKTSEKIKEAFGFANKEDDFELIASQKGLIKTYTPPPLSLLETDKGKPGVGDIKANANIIKRTLTNFGIDVEMDEISIGPSVTRYALKPAEGVKVSRIVGLQNDLALALAAHPIRVEAPIPGKSLVGIEIPNTTKTKVGLGTTLSQDEFLKAKNPLTVGLGKDISGKSHFANLAKMPHLLIAGATGSGKSVTAHVLINSLLYRNSPEQLKFIMIDPKRVELTLYNGIPHLLTPVITDAKKAILSLKWAVKEMERRYDVLESEKVRDIGSYHANVLKPAIEEAIKKQEIEKENINEANIPEAMPYIVVIIDELADLMQSYPRELEAGIVRLAQMSRAVGIHLILSTQRPSVNVITGLIKANIPARIALQVSSQIDSRTILDSAGAEKLLGAGDMLYSSGEMAQPMRMQSPFISENEVKSVVGYFKKEYREELPSEINLAAAETSQNSIFSSSLEDNDEEDDEMYEEARQVVIEAGKASTSYIQRKLRLGYARAARLMDILEERGVIGPGDGAKPREVLIKNEDAGYGVAENES